MNTESEEEGVGMRERGWRVVVGGKGGWRGM